MATMRTTLTGNETHGEKKLYYILRDKFNDDYQVWHNVLIHSVSTEIDFVIIHPSEGIYVIEVKDIILDNILSFNQDRIDYQGHSGIQNILNPISQARKNSFVIRNGLIEYPCMLTQSGKYQNKLAVPVNYGVAFPHISSDSIMASNFSGSLPPNKILDKSFFDGIAWTDRDFEKSLQSIQEIKFNPLLNQEQWNVIHQFLGTPIVKELASDKIVGVLDEIQDHLVKYKIEDQIVIEGPAGSGKSIVLIKRAAHMIQQHPDWRIGIFCYNALMSNYLKTILSSEVASENVIVSHFDKISGLGIEPASLDAILIDEGQDVSLIHLVKIKSLLNPETASFTIFHDPKQQLFEKHDLDELLQLAEFSISNVKALVRQQRSVHFILAQSFYNVLTNPDQPIVTTVEETMLFSKNYFFGMENKVSAISSGSARFFNDHDELHADHSILKELNRSLTIQNVSSISEMIEDFADFITRKVADDNALFSDFYMIFPKKYMDKKYLPTKVRSVLMQYKIPYRYIDKETGESYNPADNAHITEKDNRLSSNLKENVVTVSNIHQSKGLDAKHIAILGFNEILLPYNSVEDVFDDSPHVYLKKSASLAYVALTRATKTNHIYFTHENELQTLLQEIINTFSSTPIQN